MFFIVLDSDEILNLVQKNDFEKLKVLLQNQVDKNTVINFDPMSSGSNGTVLHAAAWYGKIDIIKGFKEELNYPDMNPLDTKKLLTPMSLAIAAGHTNIVNYYIEKEGK